MKCVPPEESQLYYLTFPYLKLVNLFKSTIQFPIDLLMGSLKMSSPYLQGRLISNITLAVALNPSASLLNHLHFLPSEY